MIGDLVDTFRISTPVFRSLFQKVEVRQVPVTVHHT